MKIYNLKKVDGPAPKASPSASTLRAKTSPKGNLSLNDSQATRCQPGQPQVRQRPYAATSVTSWAISNPIAANGWHFSILTNTKRDTRTTRNINSSTIT